jgi:IS5 family transposase
MRKRDESGRDPRLATMSFQISARPSSLRAKGDPAGWDRRIESMKGAVRSRVEHPYQTLKRRFGFAKTRHGGLGRTGRPSASGSPSSTSRWSQAPAGR